MSGEIDGVQSDLFGAGAKEAGARDAGAHDAVETDVVAAVAAAAADPYLALPLTGVRAIEASAGTGKTFTLATLVVRLVVERGLRIGEILAVTYTEAATQELRSRIRARLVLAATLVGTSTDAAHSGNATLPDDASPEALLTRTIIDTHLARGEESAATLQRRLRAAADEIDLAAIFTIHGFCARVLRDHALESGQGFDAPELMTDDTQLREAIAADLWRAHGVDGHAADDLLALWAGGHVAMAKDLSPLTRERLLRPALSELPADPTPQVRAAGEALAESFRAHGDDFRAALVTAVDSKVLNGQIFKTNWIHELFDTLHAWCASGNRDQPFTHDKLANLHRAKLLEKTNKAGAGRTPDSPLCDAIGPYITLLADAVEWQDARRVALLHALRDDARARIALHKRRQRVHTYDDLIDRVADAIDGPQSAALVARLRAQYAVALVDEFQDSDARQWRIFDRVFGADGEPAQASVHSPLALESARTSGSQTRFLAVIGDPKQAIYGFRGGDVETYLQAQATAELAPPLSLNFRSRPAVLRAIAALYEQADLAFANETAKTPPFVDERIVFRAVEPGGVRQDADYLREGQPAPALTLWRAPAPQPDPRSGKTKPYSAGRSRELATQACVAAIHAVLTDARNGNALIEGNPVQPGDIAVLVRSHAEATRIRQALAVVGIAAVSAGKQSLFGTDEARDLHALLLALLHGADDGRLRMALSTVLVGVDAAQVAAFDVDGDALRAWQLTALAWRERLLRGGPLALVGDLCAQHAQRLLGLLDGERRITNYLQLAELLQEAQAQALGLHGLVDWLSRAIAAATADDDSQLLRLESDARRVQIVTLHKAKGLEYPLVFLPFAGIGGSTRSSGGRVTVSGAEGRTLHWKLLTKVSGWDEARDAWGLAQRAEDARLLYVGLTRTRHALWLAGGAFFNHDKSPMAAMIGDAAALATTLGTAITIDDSEPLQTLPWLPPQHEDTVPPARIATRVLASDWWVYSFTQLANAEGQRDTSSAATQAAAGGLDEPGTNLDRDDFSGSITADGTRSADDDNFDPRFAGTRFGVVLHDVLERSHFASWSTWTNGAPAPAEDADSIVDHLHAAGYPQDDIADGIATLTPLIGQTLTVQLPEGVRLSDIPPDQRRAEIEFQFALAPTRVDALLALLHRHGVLSARHGFGMRRRLEGLMTGLIDLTYQHDGRWYVLDYKSNRLPGYGPAQLDEAMAHGEYDLQALIYTLALHRWLRFRLGAARDGGGYDYARDFGGVRYLFCRGLDATRSDAPGVQAWRFAPELVHALDALFAGHDTQAAA